MMLSVVTPAKSGPDSAVKSSQTNSRILEKSMSDASMPAAMYGREISVTILPTPGESIAAVFRRVADRLDGATILNMFVFGVTSASVAGNEAVRRTFGNIDWPVTWVEGAPCYGGAISGIQISALTSGSVQRIQIGRHSFGSIFEEDGARHCQLGGLGPKTSAFARGDQTKQTLEQLEEALAQGGFSLADTIRTWFYLDRILSWYDEFNRARTEVYKNLKFRTGSLPASTGIGARNCFGAALTVAARAMQPLNAHACALEAASPLQCPAPAYGSSFSRAMEITTPGARQLLVSGTASIAPGGETLWQNNIYQQVDLTMNVVKAILDARGYSFVDMTRAIAYFKHPAHSEIFANWCRANALSSLPIVSTHSDICRDDLLFELEADARKPLLSF
jgi:enamine deaminase RidA (YjgF/YER057c/UK114 family)